MTVRFKQALALAVLVMLVCGGALARPPAHGQSRSTRRADPLVAKLGKGFVSDTAKVNGTTLHYVRGGTGPAVILLHGFPQDWYEWRRVMPRLARKFTVVAVDLRGVGGSAATPGGYDAATMAEDVYQLAGRLKLERVYVVGHDLGGTVAYAFARRYPRATRGVTILDVPLPGLDPWDEVTRDPHLWHVGFHQTPGLPEKLIAGRQFIYFRHFFDAATLDKKAVSDADVKHYAQAYAAPASLRAGMEFYRALPVSGKFNEEQRGAFDVPVVLAGGEQSFAKLMPKVAEALKAHGCASVTVEVINNSAHYVVEEQPEAVAGLVERHAL